MLYDSLAEIGRYTGISPHLDKAIHFIRTHDLAALPLGRTEVDGDNVFVNVMEANAIPGEGRGFETHARYMDIQIDLEGTELCQSAQGELRESEPYDPQRDIAIWEGDATSTVVLGPGRFVLYFAGEAHKPSIRHGEEARLKKAVFKVRG